MAIAQPVGYCHTPTTEYVVPRSMPTHGGSTLPFSLLSAAAPPAHASTISAAAMPASFSMRAIFVDRG